LSVRIQKQRLREIARGGKGGTTAAAVKRKRGRGGRGVSQALRAGGKYHLYLEASSNVTETQIGREDKLVIPNKGGECAGGDQLWESTRRGVKRGVSYRSVKQNQGMNKRGNLRLSHHQKEKGGEKGLLGYIGLRISSRTQSFLEGEGYPSEILGKNKKSTISKSEMLTTQSKKKKDQ